MASRSLTGLLSPLAPSVARLAAMVGVLGAVTVVGAALLLAFEQWRELTSKTQEATQSASFFLADHAARLFEVSDLALQKAMAAVEGMSWDEIEHSRELFEGLSAIRADLPYVNDLWLNDPTGELRLTTFAFPTPASNASDRDAFMAQAAPADRLGGRLYVGSPIVGRVSSVQTFLVSRRIGRPDEPFRGAALATLDLDYFNSFWEHIPLPPAATVTLFRREDQKVLARYPARQDAAEPAFNEALDALIAADPVEGGYTELTQNDQTRFGAYHRVGSLPVYVRVSVPKSALVSLWMREAAPYGIFALAAVLSLIGLTGYARHEARRDEQNRDFLREEVARRTAALEGETRALEALNGASRILSAELDVDRTVRAVVDAGVVLTGAQYAGFLRVVTADGGAFEVDPEPEGLYVRPGLPREDFLAFLKANHREIIFTNGIVRSGDFRAEPTGDGEAPVRALLALPVVSRGGAVLGGLVFAHSEPNVFPERAERLAAGLAAQASIAMDNARLFSEAQEEIAARRATQSRQELLIRELNHRVKNTLAIVQAVAGLTARSAEGVEAFNAAFSGRLASLASTHTLLTEWSWERVPLDRLLRNQLEPYASSCVLEGPELELSATQAVPIGMALHELATNAAKYGALSTPDGKVTVRWHLKASGDETKPAILVLEWQERGGPPVTPPQRKGFGSRLLAEVLKVQLRARTHVDYAEEGLTFRLEVEVARTGEDAYGAGERTPAAAAAL